MRSCGSPYSSLRGIAGCVSVHFGEGSSYIVDFASCKKSMGNSCCPTTPTQVEADAPLHGKHEQTWFRPSHWVMPSLVPVPESSCHCFGTFLLLYHKLELHLAKCGCSSRWQKASTSVVCDLPATDGVESAHSLPSSFPASWLEYGLSGHVHSLAYIRTVRPQGPRLYHS